MSISVSLRNLPLTGLTVSSEIAPSDINLRVAETPNNDILFVKPVKIQVVIYPDGPGALLTGSMAYEIKQPCSLCAKELPLQKETPVELILRKVSTREDESVDQDLPDNEPGLYLYKDDRMELAPILEEVLLLSLSPYNTPNRDAAGNCLLCKKCPLRASEKITAPKVGTQNLGDIMKQAKINKS